MPAIPLRARLAGVAVLVLLLVHLSLVHLSPESAYARKTSISGLRSSSKGDDRKEVEDLYESLKDPGSGPENSLMTGAGANTTRAKATFVILARNSDLWSIMESIRFMEDRFNRKYK